MYKVEKKQFDKKLLTYLGVNPEAKYYIKDIFELVKNDLKSLYDRGLAAVKLKKILHFEPLRWEMNHRRFTYQLIKTRIVGEPNEFDINLLKALKLSPDKKYPVIIIFDVIMACIRQYGLYEVVEFFKSKGCGSMFDKLLEDHRPNSWGRYRVTLCLWECLEKRMLYSTPADNIMTLDKIKPRPVTSIVI